MPAASVSGPVASESPPPQEPATRSAASASALSAAYAVLLNTPVSLSQCGSAYRACVGCRWLDSAADAPARTRHRARLRRAAARVRPVARRAPEPAGADRARQLRRPAELRPADHGARVVGDDL